MLTGLEKSRKRKATDRTRDSTGVWEGQPTILVRERLQLGVRMLLRVCIRRSNRGSNQNLQISHECRVLCLLAVCLALIMSNRSLGQCVQPASGLVAPTRLFDAIEPTPGLRILANPLTPEKAVSPLLVLALGDCRAIRAVSAPIPHTSFRFCLLRKVLSLSALPLPPCRIEDFIAGMKKSIPQAHIRVFSCRTNVPSERHCQLVRDLAPRNARHAARYTGSRIAHSARNSE
jgi:hypothetical protein